MKLFKEVNKYLLANKDRSIKDVYDELSNKDHLSKAEKMVLSFLENNKKRLGV